MESLTDSSPAPPTEVSEAVRYPCTRCSKSFVSACALRGHQNAHKRKIAEEKILKLSKRVRPNNAPVAHVHDQNAEMLVLLLAPPSAPPSHGPALSVSQPGLGNLTYHPNLLPQNEETLPLELRLGRASDLKGQKSGDDDTYVVGEPDLTLKL